LREDGIFLELPIGMFAACQKMKTFSGNLGSLERGMGTFLMTGL
jgi:hypothetical protein